MSGNPDTQMLLDAMEATEVPSRLAARIGETIVLECIARGGGATRWYSVDAAAQLPELARQVRHGSRLSFYFGRQFERRVYATPVLNEILRDAAPQHDVVIATPKVDGLKLDVGLICGEADLDDYPDILRAGATLFFGLGPPRMTDDDTLVTVVLPDRDGVVRAHPY